MVGSHYAPRRGAAMWMESSCTAHSAFWRSSKPSRSYRQTLDAQTHTRGDIQTTRIFLSFQPKPTLVESRKKGRARSTINLKKKRIFTFFVFFWKHARYFWCPPHYRQINNKKSHWILVTRMNGWYHIIFLLIYFVLISSLPTHCQQWDVP